jgi:hypothetical protein
VGSRAPPRTGPRFGARRARDRCRLDLSDLFAIRIVLFDGDSAIGDVFVNRISRSSDQPTFPLYIHDDEQNPTSVAEAAAVIARLTAPPHS